MDLNATRDNQGPPKVVYTSGESEVDEGKQIYREMDDYSKNEHINDLWKLVYVRSVAAAKIKRMF